LFAQIILLSCIVGRTLCMPPFSSRDEDDQNKVVEGYVIIGGEKVPTEIFQFEAAAGLETPGGVPMVPPWHASVTLEYAAVPIDEAVPDGSEGVSLWPSSQLFGSYLLSDEGRALVKDKTVLELGCGAGLLGPVLLLSGASRVVLTDCNPMALQLAKLNCARNQGVILEALGQHKAELFSVLHLDWCTWGTEGNDLDGLAFDVVVASDVVYDPIIRDGLQRVLMGLTARNPACTVLLAAPFRTSWVDWEEDTQRNWLTNLSGRVSMAQVGKHKRQRNMSPARSSLSCAHKLGPFDVETVNGPGSWRPVDEAGHTGTEAWQPLRAKVRSALSGFDPVTEIFRLQRRTAMRVREAEQAKAG
jgi:predicted nicotinamide N-methyase